MVLSWKVGHRAPDFEYTRPGGSSASFSDLWSEGPALFVWLRHSGCPFFEETLAQLREQQPRLSERGVALACIVQARPGELRELCGAELHCIADPSRASYQAAGLGRMSLWTLFFSLDLHRRRSQASAQGFRQSWRRTFGRDSDPRQLPGAALVARGGRILWLYRGEHAGDLPAADNLLAVASEFATPVRS
jgi:AhpC/TSA antioxidant enzyme